MEVRVLIHGERVLLLKPLINTNGGILNHRVPSIHTTIRSGLPKSFKNMILCWDISMWKLSSLTSHILHYSSLTLFGQVSVWRLIFRRLLAYNHRVLNTRFLLVLNIEILLVDLRVHQTTRCAIDYTWLRDSRIFAKQRLLCFDLMDIGDISAIKLSLRCLAHVLALWLDKVIDGWLRILSRYVAIQSSSMQEACGLVQESQRVFLLRRVVPCLHVPTCRSHIYILFIQILVWGSHAF